MAVLSVLFSAHFLDVVFFLFSILMQNIIIEL